MSFKSRQKKRAIQASRRDHAQTMNGRWYLTIVLQKCACARCGGILKDGREMIYRHTPRETLCPACAQSDPEIKPRPSVRWEQQRRKGDSRRTRS